MSVEECYERLVLYFQRWYSNAVAVVERRVREVMEGEGVSREEALFLLCRRLLGFSAGAESKLRRLEELYRKGVISREVYMRLKKILEV